MVIGVGGVGGCRREWRGGVVEDWVVKVEVMKEEVIKVV